MKITVCFFVTLSIILTGCKKEKKPVSNVVTDYTISGTVWTDVVTASNVTALNSVGDNLLMTFFQCTPAVSAVYDGSVLTLNTQQLQGPGIYKFERLNGSLYGFGSLGSSTGYIYSGSDTWINSIALNTNIWGVTKFEGTTVIGCGGSPHMRILNGSNYVPMENDVNGVVYDVINYNGQLIAAGLFTHSGTTLVNHVAKWDGNSWQPLANGLQGGYVRDLVLFKGQLIAIGTFTVSGTGNTACKYAARWNGQDWVPLGTGLGTGNGSTGAYIGLDYHDQLIVAGSFEGPEGITSPNIIKWNGTQWEELAGGISGPGITAITIHKGHLYAAKSYTSSGTSYIKRLD